MTPCAADLFYSDLAVQDTRSWRWTSLSSAVRGPSPAARSGHGFAEAGGLLYLHGGNSSQGNRLPVSWCAIGLAIRRQQTSAATILVRLIGAAAFFAKCHRVFGSTFKSEWVAGDCSVLQDVLRAWCSQMQRASKVLTNPVSR
jgi:hypothetical protein